MHWIYVSSVFTSRFTVAKRLATGMWKCARHACGFQMGWACSDPAHTHPGTPRATCPQNHTWIENVSRALTHMYDPPCPSHTASHTHTHICIPAFTGWQRCTFPQHDTLIKVVKSWCKKTAEGAPLLKPVCFHYRVSLSIIKVLRRKDLFKFYFSLFLTFPLVRLHSSLSYLVTITPEVDSMPPIINRRFILVLLAHYIYGPACGLKQCPITRWERARVTQKDVEQSPVLSLRLVSGCFSPILRPGNTHL